MLLRYCEHLVPLQTTVYLPVLNFNGGSRRSVHSNEDTFLHRRVFSSLFLIKSGSLESQNYLYRAHRNTHKIQVSYHKQRIWTEDCHLWVCLSLPMLVSSIQPSRLVSQHLLHEFTRVCLYNKESNHLEFVHY